MMQVQKINRIMIAGTNSGCGKTTVTCALLKAMLNRGMKVASFKCGPDYIDPMFHSEVIGAKSRNLDPFLCGEETVRSLFAENSRDMELSLVEGVMGFYDGVGGNTDKNSSYDISEKLNIPVILVVGCKGASLSVVAMIKGYLDFRQNKIKAVILNNVSKAMFPTYKEMIEKHLNIKVLGYLPHIPEAELESRHLGLVTAAELDHLQNKINYLAESAAECMNLAELIDMAGSAEPFVYKPVEIKPIADVTLAVAKDKAFSFYYEDSLELLKQLGARLIYFSPIGDEKIPEGVDGLILGGGYPELYLKELSNNITMRESIYQSCKKGLPIFAECGGYMYLGKKIMDYPMVGAIDMCCQMTDKLQSFGYVTLTAEQETLFMKQQEQLPAHEFHYSVSDQKGYALTATKANGRSWKAGYSSENVFALYPHIHLWGNVTMAKRLIRKCEEYSHGNKH